MNETKRRILDASLELYNKYGIGIISQRRISEHLGISPGNLTYHFKKSDEIVEALYFELVEHINEVMAQAKKMEYDLKFMFFIIHTMVESFFKYRFIFLDFVHIMRVHENIKTHYEKLSVIRKQQFMEAINSLLKKEFLRKEELPDEYDFLYERFQILADFWISSVEIMKDGVKQEHLEHYKTALIQSSYPYLTEKGKKEFLKIKDFYTGV